MLVPCWLEVCSEYRAGAGVIPDSASSTPLLKGLFYVDIDVFAFSFLGSGEFNLKKAVLEGSWYLLGINMKGKGYGARILAEAPLGVVVCCFLSYFLCFLLCLYGEYIVL